jgi:hypothetical protein
MIYAPATAGRDGERRNRPFFEGSLRGSVSRPPR